MPNPRSGEKQDDAASVEGVVTQKGLAVFGLFRRSRNEALIDRLHGEIMAAARQPALFLDYGVADTVEGRFEALCLVATIAIDRMQALPSPGPEIAQESLDALFRYFDVALREMGVGDLTVPKRIKKMAQGFLGRGAAYRAGLAEPDDSVLALAVARNIYGDEARADDPRTSRMVRFARAHAAQMQTLDVRRLLDGPLPHTDAASVS